MANVILSEKAAAKITALLGTEPSTKQIVLTEKEAMKLGSFLDKANASITQAGEFLLAKLNGEEAPVKEAKPRAKKKKKAAAAE